MVDKARKTLREWLHADGRINPTDETDAELVQIFLVYATRRGFLMWEDERTPSTVQIRWAIPSGRPIPAVAWEEGMTDTEAKLLACAVLLNDVECADELAQGSLNHLR
jgi:hypothetical protein